MSNAYGGIPAELSAHIYLRIFNVIPRAMPEQTFCGLFVEQISEGMCGKKIGRNHWKVLMKNLKKN